MKVLQYILFLIVTGLLLPCAVIAEDSYVPDTVYMLHYFAKEKDSESGYNYFGARYYTDNIMMWMSVDPMSDKRPSVSPYSYCQNNPIGRVDMWGMLDKPTSGGGKSMDD